MAQYIYLVRHGKPVLPGKGSWCIGNRTDLPLSDIGKKQAEAWRSCFNGMEAFYCSPLRRSRETATILSGHTQPVIMLPGLDEIDVGDWDGLSFTEIRQRYAALYEQRGEDWSQPPQGGETLASAASRMIESLLQIVRQHAGDAVVAGHEGSIRALVWRLQQLDTRADAMFRQPYGSVTVVKYEYGAFEVTAAGKLPEDVPDDNEIEEMWDHCGTPEQVRKHCRAVCEESRFMFELVRDAGYILPWGSLRAAALLHDACRLSGRQHPDMAASYLRERGYLKTARLIAMHHSQAIDTNVVSSEAILFLADKLIDGQEKVDLEERFAKSAYKCRTEAAKANHKKQYDTAVLIRDTIAGIVTGKGDAEQ